MMWCFIAQLSPGITLALHPAIIGLETFPYCSDYLMTHFIKVCALFQEAFSVSIIERRMEG
jgi:hypothetical protein